MDKFASPNNNKVKSDDTIVKPKLIENKTQLTDTKKISFGFDLNDSIIDVFQNGYNINYGEDILFTYGIDPCCGLVLCDENVRILFHLDGSITPEDVLDITDKINLSQNATIIVIPGSSCGMTGSFNYEQIEEYYKKRGYEVIEQRIPSTFGFVILDLDKVTIGTSIDRSQDAILPIPKRRVKTLSPNNNDIFLVLEDVNGIIEEILILNNNNNKKSR